MHNIINTKHNNYRTMLLQGFIISTLMVVAWGCEQTIENPDLPYEEKLVVSGFLRNDTSAVVLTVTHTLPLTEPFTIEKAAIPDAKVILSTPDGDVTLRYDSQRHQYIGDGITPQEGAQYSLRVEWEGKTATATTVLPLSPEVFSSYYTREVENDGWTEMYKTIFTFNVRNRPNTCYAAIDWFYQNGADTSSWSYFDRWTPYTDTYFEPSLKDTIKVRRIEIEYGGSYPTGIDFARLYALDAAYHTYQKSRYGNDDDNIFGSAGTNPVFNVHGDGIGYFVGISRAKDIVRTPVK